MNLYVLGFMGTGKTTVGSQLAAELGFTWLDLDHYLTERAGQSISDMFRTSGEAFFRDFEQKCLEEISRLDRHVVTTGGGTVLRQRNREIMQRSGLRVTLTATVPCIWERVKDDTDRPLLQHENPLEQIQKLLQERAPFYRQTDLIVDTTDKQVEDIVREVAVFVIQSTLKK